MLLYEFLVAPFVEFAFMRRALIGAIVLVLSACPIGVFLILRRLSLAGDALSHALLPGVAIGFLLFGLDIVSMTVGGLIAGLVVAAGAGVVSRYTAQKEDASMAAFYLISLALGVLIISLRGNSVDLMHVLFGNVLALDNQALALISLICVTSVVTLAILWRALVAECLDPLFLRSVSGLGGIAHTIFLVLVVLNLIAGFQSLGTLLSVGLMVLPGTAARFWADRAGPMCVVAVLLGWVSVTVGLLLSYHAALPSGPAIVLVAGIGYVLSLLFAPRGIVGTRLTTQKHRTA